MDQVTTRVLGLVERHGWNATAFQTLEPGYDYFFHGDDACVAYVDTGGAWVAAGAPIAATASLPDVTAAFVAAARAARRRCCFFAVEDRLRASVGDRLRYLSIGEQPVWDPALWTAVLAGGRSLREQLRRARARGVRVREASAAELASGATREALRALTERWLATRGLPAMRFLLSVELFHLPGRHRCLVAELDGRLVAFAGVVPVPARGGWLLEDLVRDPTAPNGTGELLVDAVMRAASDAGVGWLTLGLAPLAGDVAAPLRLARRGSRLLYDFEGVRAYKAKLGPSAWMPIHLAFPPTQGPIASVVDALAGFARGGFPGFGLRALLRGPTLLLGLLALLLVPWTVLLALAPVEPFFPAPWIKWAWVGFDALVAAGLFRLARRRSAALATALAVAATADALMTSAQATWWNLPRAAGPVAHAVIAVACAAPVFAAVTLWGAAARARKLR
ncbi:MAG TPA: phosphatidylglycerol lysyltransferase domain-containing protein [Polyangia bacterium]|jgi:phosphatidylglycerol lysyltransferase